MDKEEQDKVGEFDILWMENSDWARVLIWH